MSVIDKLVDAGQDPLEAVFLTQTTPEAAKIVAPYLVTPESNAAIDDRIHRAFNTWTPEMKKRLRDLIESRMLSRE